MEHSGKGDTAALQNTFLNTPTCIILSVIRFSPSLCLIVVQIRASPVGFVPQFLGLPFQEVLETSPSPDCFTHTCSKGFGSPAKSQARGPRPFCSALLDYRSNHCPKSLLVRVFNVISVFQLQKLLQTDKYSSLFGAI